MQDHTPTDSGSASPPGHLYPGPTAPLGWRGPPACHCALALAGTACAPPRCRPPPLPAPRPRRGVRSLTGGPNSSAARRLTRLEHPPHASPRPGPRSRARAPPSPRERHFRGRHCSPAGLSHSPREGPRGEQGPAAPTLAHGDLEAQGCEEAREAGTAGGGLTPANVSRTLGGPTASYTGHGRPSKWLTPAHGWRRP